jgi:hypothetical protein
MVFSFPFVQIYGSSMFALTKFKCKTVSKESLKCPMEISLPWLEFLQQNQIIKKYVSIGALSSTNSYA